MCVHHHHPPLALGDYEPKGSMVTRGIERDATRKLEGGLTVEEATERRVRGQGIVCNGVSRGVGQVRNNRSNGQVRGMKGNEIRCKGAEASAMAASFWCRVICDTSGGWELKVHGVPFRAPSLASLIIEFVRAW